MSADSVSRYRILSKLGHGGRGRVCLAEDRTLGRRVALKFLTAAGGRDGSAHRKLIREAQAAARLDHPFICKVYEVGESGGEPFIAMEYLEGEVLKDRIARGPLPLADALRLGVEIAEALECAQANAVVHRDLKPGNVMLTRDGHAKVMDFGIATVPSLAATPDGTLATTVTATGTVTGTLAYMSPEQLRGQPVDSRSDIFAFGLVLYEMLTGRHPFAGPTPIATAEAILHGPVPPLEVHVEKPPPLLSHIMARLLARDRDGRFQTFRDVRSELLSLAGGGPAAAPASRRAGWRRPRLAASAVVVAIAALAIWQVPNRLDRPALAFSERDWIVIADVDNQTGDPVFDRSLSTALTVGLSQSQYLNVLPPGRVQEALQRMQRPATDPLDQPAAAELAVREGAKAVLACSIAQVGHVYQLTAQLIDPQTRAAVLTESERADRKDDVLPALDSLATRIRRGLGESLGSLSRQQLPMPEATTASLDALRMYADADRAPDRDTRWRLLEQAVAIDPAFAMAHAALGLDYYLQPDRATRLQGEAHLQKALALLDRLSFRERLLITALAEDSRGHREAAATAYQAYLTAYPDDRNVWFRLAWTQMATLRRYEQAVEAFNRVIAIDPFHSAALINLATSLQGLRKDQEAMEAYERAFALRPDEMFGVFVNHEYGFTLVRLGRMDRAAEVFRNMQHDASPEKRARGWRSQGLLQTFQGRYKAGAESFRQAVVVNAANGLTVSEFRDRLFLVSTLERRGDAAVAAADLRALDALMARLALGPEWLQHPIKLFARTGRLARAQALLGPMTDSAGQSTADSSTNRNVQLDRAYLAVARGEIALAEGRPDEAVGHLETASQIDPRNANTLESLAAAYFAAGRLADAAAAYDRVIARVEIANESQGYWFDAHLRLADLRQRLGDESAARALYERILAVWRDADADLPALREAQRRLARLDAGRRPAG